MSATSSNPSRTSNSALVFPTACKSLMPKSIPPAWCLISEARNDSKDFCQCSGAVFDSSALNGFCLLNQVARSRRSTLIGSLRGPFLWFSATSARQLSSLRIRILCIWHTYCVIVDFPWPGAPSSTILVTCCCTFRCSSMVCRAQSVVPPMGPRVYCLIA